MPKKVTEFPIIMYILLNNDHLYKGIFAEILKLSASCLYLRTESFAISRGKIRESLLSRNICNL